MRPLPVALVALSICGGCAAPRPEPPNLVDFTTQQSIGVVFDRLDQLSRRCFQSAGLEIESDVFRDVGSGAIELKEADGSVALSINLKALSPGQTMVKITFPHDARVESSWVQAMQTYAERETGGCPASRPR